MKHQNTPPIPTENDHTLETGTQTTPKGPSPERRANAVILMLARNSDLDGMIQSIRALEDRWNVHYTYPYVLLNDQEWEEHVKE